MTSFPNCNMTDSYTFVERTELELDILTFCYHHWFYSYTLGRSVANNVWDHARDQCKCDCFLRTICWSHAKRFAVASVGLDLTCIQVSLASDPILFQKVINKVRLFFLQKLLRIFPGGWGSTRYFFP